MSPIAKVKSTGNSTIGGTGKTPVAAWLAGRIAAYGSVKVTQLMAVERFSHVQHLVSEVKGAVAPGQSALSAFRATFPAGTMTGAPKVRAMEIIADLERDRRGVYAGAVGYLDFAGNLDCCITIRTALLKDGKAYVQAGGGIVADSVPSSEWQETQNKARAVLRAAEMALAGLDSKFEE